jgi:predicted RNase H-like HicB family nuclease
MEFELKLPAKVEKDKEFGGYSSCIPQLDIWAQGDTKEEAKSNLTEAAELFIISCLELGTFDAVLRKCGIHPAKKHLRKIARPAPHGYSSVS